MVGVVLVVLALLVVGPIAVMFGGAVWSALLSACIMEDVNAPAGSEPS